MTITTTTAVLGFWNFSSGSSRERERPIRFLVARAFAAGIGSRFHSHGRSDRAPNDDAAVATTACTRYYSRTPKRDPQHSCHHEKLSFFRLFFDKWAAAAASSSMSNYISKIVSGTSSLSPDEVHFCAKRAPFKILPLFDSANARCGFALRVTEKCTPLLSASVKISSGPRRTLLLLLVHKMFSSNLPI